MDIKYMIKKIRYSLRDYIVNRPNRKKLEKHDFVLISSDCTAGTVYKDLKCRFNSPTINFFFSGKDFVKFTSNMQVYLDSPVEIMDSKENYPVAKIGDITAHLVHYRSVQEFKKKWNERTKRISVSRQQEFYYIMNDRNNCTEEDILAFNALPFPNKVFFTHVVRSDIDCAFCLNGSENDEKVKPVMSYCGIIRRYYDQFDWVEFINSGKRKRRKRMC